MIVMKGERFAIAIVVHQPWVTSADAVRRAFEDTGFSDVATRVPFNAATPLGLLLTNLVPEMLAEKMMVHATWDRDAEDIDVHADFGGFEIMWMQPIVNPKAGATTTTTTTAGTKTSTQAPNGAGPYTTTPTAWSTSTPLQKTLIVGGVAAGLALAVQAYRGRVVLW